MTFPKDGVIYEPRAFWSVARIDQSGPDLPFARIDLPREHFFNGEPYPINLTHMIVSGINYIMDEYDAGVVPPNSAADFRNSRTAAQEFMRLSIAAPWRQYYTRKHFPLPAWFGRSNDGPSFETERVVGGIHSASVYNTARWTFDKPMTLPRLGDLEFEFGSITLPPFAAAATQPTARIGFHEKAVAADLWPGDVRTSPQAGFPIEFILNTPPAWGGPSAFDGFGQGVLATTTQQYPSTSKLTAKRYGDQSPGATGSKLVSGFTVAVDQVAYDAEIDAQSPNPGTSNVVAPISTRLPTRARMRNGGTGAWWWREGAPLSLVTPSRTPSYVRQLPEGFTLVPGGQLDLSLEVPPPVDFGGSTPIGAVYQIGVSFCGYAIIEG